MSAERSTGWRKEAPYYIAEKGPNFGEGTEGLLVKTTSQLLLINFTVI